MGDVGHVIQPVYCVQCIVSLFTLLYGSSVFFVCIYLLSNMLSPVLCVRFRNKYICVPYELCNRKFYSFSYPV